MEIVLSEMTQIGNAVLPAGCENDVVLPHLFPCKIVMHGYITEEDVCFPATLLPYPGRDLGQRLCVISFRIFCLFQVFYYFALLLMHEE